jgi:hypothetical protein
MRVTGFILGFELSTIGGYVAISRFWRSKESSLTFFAGIPSDIQKVDRSVFSRFSEGQGIVVGDLNSMTDCGEVNWVGVIESVSEMESSVKIVWRNADFILKPTPSGRVYWRKHDWFNFADAVIDRYMFDAIFSDLFDDTEWRQTRQRIQLSPNQPRIYELVKEDLKTESSIASSDELPGLPVVNRSMNPMVGYVYLIWSQYGYKIGKAVNVKSRTKLFEVKLPFPIRVEHYARFSDYTQAERSLHLHFHEKRMEGEWFALSEEDVAFIKTLGAPQAVDRL